MIGGIRIPTVNIDVVWRRVHCGGERGTYHAVAAEEVSYEDHQSLFRSKQCGKLDFLLVFIKDLEIPGFGKRLGRYDVVVCGRHGRRESRGTDSDKTGGRFMGTITCGDSLRTANQISRMSICSWKVKASPTVTDEIMNVSRGKEVDWGQLYSVQFAEVSQISALLGITLSRQVCL